MRSLIRPDRGRAISTALVGYGPGCQLLGRELAKKIGVPYYEERLVERFLGHRLVGAPKEANQAYLAKPQYRYAGVMTETWPLHPETGLAIPMHEVQLLTEEVWGRDYWPNTADDVPTAVRHLPDGKLSGMYYHGPSMCLVLLHPDGMKVGIRATTILHPKLGVDKAAVAALGRLKAA